jgi:hypothetical protein
MEFSDNDRRLTNLRAAGAPQDRRISLIEKGVSPKRES